MLRTHALKLALLLLVATCLGLSRSITTAQTNTPPCPTDGYLPPRLVLGQWAHVISPDANNLRADPTTTAAKVGHIPSDDIFRVLDGPRCADHYVWWQIKYDGLTAWTAEGDAQSGKYWLESLAGQSDVSSTTTTPDIEGCQKPPEAYDRITVDYATLNLRTLAMLDHAQELYSTAGGILHFRDGIMQGSYNPGAVAASFGTHDGGGALDISVRDPKTRAVLTDEIPLMLHTLRVAGFAAWLRQPDELYKGSPIHIHAIAIGDAELSDAARGQIDGTFGYLRGYNGLPQDNGIPLPDTSGAMVICNWMKDLGYHDMR